MSDIESEPSVLIEGPAWGDAEFYGNWLLAAAKAQTFWVRALKNPRYEKQVKSLCSVYIPGFGIAGALMITYLRPHLTRFPLSLLTEEGDHFVMMLGMGFFQETSQYYQMAIPCNLTAAKLKRAMLNYTGTEDEECLLHPERLVSSRPLAETKALARRLWAVDRFDAETKCVGRA
jgi:hypothetical protein